MIEILALAIVLALYGALIGWVVRKFISLSLSWSYIVGVAIALPSMIYLNSIRYDSFEDALLTSGLSGIVAAALLITTARRRHKADGEGST